MAIRLFIANVSRWLFPFSFAEPEIGRSALSVIRCPSTTVRRAPDKSCAKSKFLSDRQESLGSIHATVGTSKNKKGHPPRANALKLLQRCDVSGNKI